VIKAGRKEAFMTTFLFLAVLVIWDFCASPAPTV
jgi:hypothetical protein